MQKSVTKTSQKSEAELHKELAQLRNEITKSKLENTMSPQKDTNTNMKKRKQIAVILTVLNQSRLKSRILDTKVSEK